MGGGMCGGMGACGGTGGCMGGGMMGNQQNTSMQGDSSIPTVDSPEFEATVWKFIEISGLDERATEAMTNVPKETQRAVMERGDLSQTQNPSAALLGRLKAIQNGGMNKPAGNNGFGGMCGNMGGCGMNGGGMNFGGNNFGNNNFGNNNMGGGGMWGGNNFGGNDSAGHVNPSSIAAKNVMAGNSEIPEDLAARVEQFIMEAGLDERATDAMRTVKPEIQLSVLEGGAVSETRNASSAVMGRIAAAQRSMNLIPNKQNQQPNMQQMQMQQMQMQQMQMQQQMQMNQQQMSQKQMHMNQNQGGDGGAVTTDVEQFIAENSLDDRASEALRSSTPEIQWAVLQRGAVTSLRNPSSALIGRLRDAQKATAAPY